MHIPESAYQSDAFRSAKTMVFVAEVICILCNRVVGTAVDTRWPPIETVLFEAEGSKVLRREALNRLRCTDCGGNTTPTEVTTKLLRRERPSDLQIDEPRRGRPPKWLVAQRAARLSNRGA